jgi:hypothetical protein
MHIVIWLYGEVFWAFAAASRVALRRFEKVPKCDYGNSLCFRSAIRAQPPIKIVRRTSPFWEKDSCDLQSLHH